MRVRSLAGRLLVLQLTVVAVTVAAGALITMLVARERTEPAARDRSLTVARTVAALPELAAGDAQQRPERHRCSPWPSACATSRTSTSSRSCGRTGSAIRIRSASLIGKRFVGTFEPAARGTRRSGDDAGDARPPRCGPSSGHSDGRRRRARRGRRAHRRDRGRGCGAAPGSGRARGGDARHRRPARACCSPAVSTFRRSASSRRRSPRSTRTTMPRCTRCARASSCSTRPAGLRSSTTTRSGCSAATSTP